MEGEKIKISAKLKSEVADEYGVTVKTLMAWIKKASILSKKSVRDKYFKPTEVETIYQMFGKPD